MNKLTRREFLAFSLTPVLVPVAAASSHDAGLSALPSSGDPPAAQAEEELAAGDECPGCGSWGAITCPACDGTGMWTEASESAGPYQDEAARALDHCAWCNEWGEVIGEGLFSSPHDASLGSAAQDSSPRAGRARSPVTTSSAA